ncbi:MAG: alpha/beta fold hydrolase [Bacteroidales bacterium]|nr:alpha/beta fold hydrolase [Bacteroidales bacterium]
MKKIILLLLVFLSQQIYCQNVVDGYWLDTVHLQSFDLRLVLQIETKDSILHVNMYSIDQTQQAIPASSVKLQQDTILVGFKSINAKCKLVYQAKEDRLQGEFKQGTTFPLSMTRVSEVPVLKRPQTPQAPYPYKREELKIGGKKKDPQIAATLTIPQEDNPYVVVLIPGSGPNGRTTKISGHDYYAVLADLLSRKGIAVLYYDKRGIGDSEGDYMSATTFDFYGDACRLVKYLQKDKRFASNKIGVVGHSEGGEIATMMAANKRMNLSYAILMAAPVQQGSDLLVSQVEALLRAEQIGEDTIQAFVNQQQFIENLLLKYKENTLKYAQQEIDKHVKSLDTMDIELYLWQNYTPLQLSSSLSPWLLTFISLNPHSYFARLQCDVLALNGDKDVQVPPFNIEMMKEVAPKNKLTTAICAGKNHLFQTCEIGSPREYGYISETISEEIVDMIVNWIKGLNR